MAPIIASGCKMLVPIIVILPGLLGLAVLPEKLVPESVAAVTGAHSYNDVLPLMLARYCGPGLLGLGVTALIAGFMSGMAGNVSAFTTVWTYDIYRPFINSKGSDHHYVNMGRWTTVIGVLISVGTAYLVMQFASIMDYVQALFSFFIAPLFGTVVLGMLWRRATRLGGFWGLLCGTLSSIGMWAWVKVDPSALHYVALSSHARQRINRVGIRIDGSSFRRRRPSVPEACFLGSCGGCRFGRSEHYFLVTRFSGRRRPATWFPSGFSSVSRWP